MTRHQITLHCAGQTRTAMLTSDEIEDLWSYAKSLCLPRTILRGVWRGHQYYPWVSTGRNLTPDLPLTTGQGCE